MFRDSKLRTLPAIWLKFSCWIDFSTPHVVGGVDGSGGTTDDNGGSSNPSHDDSEGKNGKDDGGENSAPGDATDDEISVRATKHPLCLPCRLRTRAATDSLSGNIS